MNRLEPFRLDHPYGIGADGRTARTNADDHLRDMIEQVLFTSPGERVNRPDFGAGLLQLVFMPNSDELAATVQFLVQGSLQQWLGDLIQVVTVAVETDDSTLRVIVEYIVRRTGERQVAEFEHGGQAP